MASSPLAVGARIVRLTDRRRFKVTFVNHRAPVPVFSADSDDGQWSHWGGPIGHLMYGVTFALASDYADGVPCEAAGPNHPENANKWCRYEEPHNHGSFDCATSCPCRQSQVPSTTGSES